MFTTLRVRGGVGENSHVKDMASTHKEYKFLFGIYDFKVKYNPN